MLSDASTANTFAFALWELAKDLDLQRRIREEIKVTSLKARQEGEADIPFSSYEGMHLLVAFMKVRFGSSRYTTPDAHSTQEVLRFHPAAFNANRQALEDDVIPLLNPVRLASGKLVNEIPIAKGQKIWINIPGYNRCRRKNYTETFR